MFIQNVPEIYSENHINNLDLFVYDLKMTDTVENDKINLSLHMFSFLQTGQKQIHFSDTSVAVNKSQSILVKKGNCIWTELLDKESSYYCKLLFFSERQLKGFLTKNNIKKQAENSSLSFFIINNDDFITSYLNSLSIIASKPSQFAQNMLSNKFEELILYLISKYGHIFIAYLYSLISNEPSHFNDIIKSKTYSNLKLEEIAFLCNMSLSTFKRHFKKEYGISPGKWLRERRLERAKELLELGKLKPSDIYFNLGYNNLSNFSAAFKKKYGKSPKQIF